MQIAIQGIPITVCLCPAAPPVALPTHPRFPASFFYTSRCKATWYSSRQGRSTLRGSPCVRGQRIHQRSPRGRKGDLDPLRSLLAFLLLNNTRDLRYLHDQLCYFPIPGVARLSPQQDPNRGRDIVGLTVVPGSPTKELGRSRPKVPTTSRRNMTDESLLGGNTSEVGVGGVDPEGALFDFKTVEASDIPADIDWSMVSESGQYKLHGSVRKVDTEYPCAPLLWNAGKPLLFFSLSYVASSQLQGP